MCVRGRQDRRAAASLRVLLPLSHHESDGVAACGCLCHTICLTHALKEALSHAAASFTACVTYVLNKAGKEKGVCKREAVVCVLLGSWYVRASLRGSLERSCYLSASLRSSVSYVLK
jgi:hypothetical protein